jgi:hypothetical protein
LQVRSAVVRRPVGTALILGGCLVLIVEIRSLDGTVATLSWSRGVHVSDLLGLLIVAVGVALLWRA